MAKSSSGSSLLQARSDAHSHAHSLFHRIHDDLSNHAEESSPLTFENDNIDVPSHSHSQGHHHHLHRHENRRDSKEAGFETDLGAATELETPSGVASASLAQVRDIGGGITEKIVVNALKDNGLDPYVTHVVQTISLVEYVDAKGSAYMISTVFAQPNTVVMDPSGKTISESSPKHQTQAGPGLPSPSNAKTDTTANAGDSSKAGAETGTLSSTSDSRLSQTVSPSPHISSVAIRPSAGVVRNGTHSK